MLVFFDGGRKVRPRTPRAKKDVANGKMRGADPRRVVEGTGRQGPDSGRRLERESEIGAAAAAEFDIEPPPRLVRDMPVAPDVRPRDLHLAALVDDLGAEGRAGAALAPCAMTDRDPQRLAARPEARRAAKAPAGLLHRLSRP